MSHHNASSTSSGPKPYRHVNQGDGGTYTFPAGAPSFIGTSRCETCVGVYFAIDDNRCFVAHINADTIDSKGVKNRETNWATAARIKADIIARLKGEQQRSQWGPVSDRMRNSLIMVCLEPAHGWTSQVGEAVSEAVVKWLQPTSPQKPRRCGAFVVQHSSGNPEFFDWEPSNTEWHKQDEPEHKGWGMLIDRVD